MRTHTGFTKAIVLLMTFAASFVLAVQLGCSGSNSPTAVAPPPPGPAPTPVPIGAKLTFIVDNPGGHSGEILFDGRPIWSGQVVEDPYFSNNYLAPFQHVFSLDQAAVTPGVHTLTFTVPGRTAVNYLLSGWIDLYWSPPTVGRVGSWLDESAWLKTGKDWKLEILFPATPNG